MSQKRTKNGNQKVKIKKVGLKASQRALDLSISYGFLINSIQKSDSILSMLVITLTSAGFLSAPDAIHKP